MATQPAIPINEKRKQAAELIEQYGGATEAEAATGIPQRTLRDRASKYEDAAEDFTLPQFPDDDMDVEEIIDLQCKRFSIRKEADDARQWFPITFKSNKAIGIVYFGDPHTDDNGCNWPQLKKDVDICRQNEGVYGVNIGDTTNNWAGRLAALYAKQDTSAKTARKLAKWFMLESGVSWLVWLIGNHDAWGDGAAVLKEMGKQYKTKPIEMHDWVAKFKIKFPNGYEPKVIAAHDFKGHSQWNPLHGPMKTGQMGAEADLFVCGHKHNWAMFQWENADRGLSQTFIRVRGYKFMDEYARRGMFPEQNSGCSIMVVFDPAKKSITPFEDLEEGASYLATLRAA